MTTDPKCVDDLWSMDLAAFTAGRRRLVARLEVAGHAEEAAAVAKLRKPPITAWVLNRLARERPDLVEAVLRAGDELAEATRSAMEPGADGDGSRIGELARVHRAASEDLLDATGGVAGRTLGPALRARMAATIHAAAVDASVADALRRGVLRTDQDRSGLGFADATPAPRRRPALRVIEGGGQRERSADRAARLAARAEAQAHEVEAERRRSEAKVLRRRANASARRAGIAEREALRLTVEAERLEAEAARVRESAEAASKAAADAKAVWVEAKALAAEAEAAVAELEDPT